MKKSEDNCYKAICSQIMNQIMQWKSKNINVH